MVNQVTSSKKFLLKRLIKIDDVSSRQRNLDQTESNNGSQYIFYEGFTTHINT